MQRQKFHLLAAPRLMPYSRLLQGAFVLFCYHHWQSRRGSSLELLLAFQNDATLGTDKLGKNVELSRPPFGL
ncbi:hypothetical protein CRYUN_Cryun29cG0077000 [Craigia yunnanensis]